MADIHIDDERLKGLLEQAVKDMLASERVRLDQLTTGFLNDAAKGHREAVKEIEEEREKFEARAHQKLSEADAAIASFDGSLAEKKKKVEDALNVKVLAGFTAVVLIGTLVAAGYFADRAYKLKRNTDEVVRNAADLQEASGRLNSAIENANKIYNTAIQPSDAGSMKTLTALVARIDADTQRIDKEVAGLKTSVASLQKNSTSPSKSNSSQPKTK